MEPSEIASILEKIADSGMSIDKYLDKHEVPFSRPQYFRYKARFAAQGLEGLNDRRSRGNHRKLTPDAEGFIRGIHQANPELSLQEICDSVEITLGIRVDRSTVSRFLSRVGEQVQWPRPVEPERISTPCGGFEIIGALALHLGWTKHTAEVIVQEVEGFRNSDAFRQERVRRDRKGRNSRGQFTGEYNRRADIRQKRFASVEEKRKHKNYSRMALFQARQLIVERKCLGILALPLITLNGTTRSANTPLGNALEHFCGYNYQHGTLDKFLRELKYLGVSDRLLREQVSFWQAHWRKFEENLPALPFLCYYVDGNTKPLWA
jgi:transposase